MRCIQFRWPENPLCSSCIPALPPVLSFRVTLVCSRLEQLLTLSRLSCPPCICRARAWLCGPPHTWAASRSPCVDAGCTLGERHHRSPHPTSPRPDAPGSWGPQSCSGSAVASGVLGRTAGILLVPQGTEVSCGLQSCFTGGHAECPGTRSTREPPSSGCSAALSP